MSEINEIWNSLRAWKIWLAIAFEDVVGRYRRTTLGPLWVVLSQTAFIFGLYVVRAAVSPSQDHNFLVFLAISVPAWNLISSGLTDGSSALVRSKGYIESYPLPMPIYMIRSTAAAIVNFFHVLIVFVLILIAYQQPVTLNYLMFVPGLFIVALFCFGACLGLGSLGARFRDLNPALTSATGFLFVFSPIFWQPTAAQKTELIVRLNPFYYLLEVLREPFLSPTISPDVWGIAVVISVVTLIAGAITYKIMRPSVVYWL